MEIEMLKGKIHRATVTQAELDYVGSITVDEALLDAAEIREYQKVQVVKIELKLIRLLARKTAVLSV